ncbi:radical SAM protein [Pseudochryseolinea flava]|uniref:Radical SAM protein n=1 Tax=Pseudochryseolinea flava TaxID=2059302 RepID=A0A364Y780_9BACT|nr:radical SAM protein [Pseudochryseolinea flava]RAW02753.1 radical SAM protein [Pseudochryseolinea flava]
MLNRLLTLATNRISALPVLVLMPHSRCNCRCVMCDIWKANHNKQEINSDTLALHIDSFRKLGVKHVAFSGGEALMHDNLWKLCEQLKTIGVKITLLSTGITLKNHAKEVVHWCDEVTVSLDGSHDVHNQIRNLPRAYEKLQEGIAAIKIIKTNFRITARTVIQKLNYRDFPHILEAAKSLAVDQISFLPADLSSTAFNRENPWTQDKVVEVGLDKNETDELQDIIEKSFLDYAELYEQRFVAESKKKMLDIVQYYRASLGLIDFPAKKCNAPWVSAVIETDGEVKPCFFLPAYGNIYKHSFSEIVNSQQAIAYRKNLNMRENATCQKCVCSLHLGLRQML